MKENMLIKNIVGRRGIWSWTSILGSIIFSIFFSIDNGSVAMQENFFLVIMVFATYLQMIQHLEHTHTYTVHIHI